MDLLTLLLVQNKSISGFIIFDIIIFVFIMLINSYITKINIVAKFNDLMNKYWRKEKIYNVSIRGVTKTDSWNMKDFGKIFLAVSKFIIDNCGANYELYNILRNSVGSIEEKREINKILIENNLIYKELNIHIVVDVQRIIIQNSNFITYEYTINLYCNNFDNIDKFIKMSVKEYELFKNKFKNERYNFIQSNNGGKEFENRFTLTTINNYENNECINMSFNTFFSPHKEQFINDLKQLKDKEYYKYTGQKCKKGYLLYGKAGCGKTLLVDRIAYEDKRHVISINLANIKTLSDVDNIFTLNEIFSIKFKPNEIIILFDEIIILFDEIDKFIGKSIEVDNLNTIKDEVKKDEDKSDVNILSNLMTSGYNSNKTLNENILSLLLSKIDGIGTYDELIIIATCNDISKLPTQIFRHGRLDLIEFDYMEHKYIIEMLNHNYKIILNELQIEMLKILDKKYHHQHYNILLINIIILINLLKKLMKYLSKNNKL